MKPLTINTPARQESTPSRPYQAWLIALTVTGNTRHKPLPALARMAYTGRKNGALAKRDQ